MRCHPPLGMLAFVISWGVRCARHAKTRQGLQLLPLQSPQLESFESSNPQVHRVIWLDTYEKGTINICHVITHCTWWRQVANIIHEKREAWNRLRPLA